MKPRIVLFAHLAAGAAAFPAPFAMVLPGLALALLHDDARPFGLAVPLSAAAWAILLQVLYGWAVPARIPVTAVLVLSAAAVAWRVRRFEIPPAAAAILAPAVLFRLLPAAVFPCASGIDMSFHTFLGARIAAGGIPDDLSPLADGPVAGLPVGFHLWMASLGLEPNAMGLWGSVAVYALLTLAYYRALAGFFSPTASAFAAVLLTFVSDKPQTAVRFGPHAFVLAAALAVLGAALWLEGIRAGRLRILPAALLLAGSVVVHPTPAYGAALLLIPAGVGLAWTSFDRRTVAASLTVAVAALLLASPFLLAAASRGLSPEAEGWTREYLRTVIPRLTDPTGLDWVRGFFWQIRADFGAQFSLLALVLFGWALWRRRALAAAFAAALAALMVVSWNVKSGFMPFSVLLYPDRIAHLLLAPVAAMAAAAIDEHWPAWRAGPRARLVAVAALVTLAASGLHKAIPRYLVTYARNVVVGREDHEAMAWLRDHTPPDAVVHNQPDDAGLWIPAFAGRRITRPQGAPTYFETPKRPRPGWIYIGPGAEVRDPAALGFPGALRVFERGRTAVYAAPQ